MIFIVNAVWHPRFFHYRKVEDSQIMYQNFWFKSGKNHILDFFCSQDNGIRYKYKLLFFLNDNYKALVIIDYVVFFWYESIFLVS